MLQTFATHIGAAAGQVPQSPPHPSSPHSLSAQAGVQTLMQAPSRQTGASGGHVPHPTIVTFVPASGGGTAINTPPSRRGPSQAMSRSASHLRQ